MITYVPEQVKVHYRGGVIAAAAAVGETDWAR